ncbi:hypothetical protein Tco_0880246 [Tanacetum coccineum]
MTCVISKTIASTSMDDQIDSSIIFDGPYEANNSSTSSHHLRSLDRNNAILELASSVQNEADTQKRLNNELKEKQKLLQQELETYKDRVKMCETKSVPFSTYNDTCEELKCEIQKEKECIDNLLNEKDKLHKEIYKAENKKLIIQHETKLKKQDFQEKENWYLDDILDL